MLLNITPGVKNEAAPSASVTTTGVTNQPVPTAESADTAQDHPAPHRAPPWATRYQRSLIITDAVVIAVVVISSQALRFNTKSRVQLEGFGSVSYWLISILLSIAWLAALAVNGAWDRKILGAGPHECARIMRASLFLFGFVAIVSYLASAEIARSYLLIALPLGLFGLTGGRWVWRRLLVEYRLAGSHLSSVLVVGGTTSAVALAAKLRGAPDAGFRVVGLCLPGGPSAWSEQASAVDHGFAVVGDLDDIAGAVQRVGADMVAVASSESFGPEEVRRMAWTLEGTGVAIALAPALTDVAGPRIHIRPVAGLPLLYVEEPRFRGPKLIAKTMVDVIGAGLGLLLLLPVLLIVAVAIKLGDGGPVFFRQQRVGLGGKGFRVWKFRSMIVNANIKIDEARQGAQQQANVFYKSAADSRITPIGRFIRRTSIDELPQLFNVLAGQMSIVGPRPLVPGEGAEVGNFLERRMLLRPGITGLWQVSGRSDLLASERIRMDFDYVENWSVAGDLVIMARTVSAVLRQHGAY